VSDGAFALIQSDLYFARALLFFCAHFPVEGVGLAAGTGCFMLRRVNTRFEWRLDLDGVGVGVGVGAAFSKM
jgi:hypothetical protein